MSVKQIGEGQQMFRKRLRRWLSRPDSALDHPWLRRLGPAMQHPRIWHVGRRSVASGVAVGLFFGILLPIGQVPSAAICAVLMRANLATAIAGTFVTNPLTYVPVYVAAYLLGCFLTGIDPALLVDAGAGFGGLWLQFESTESTARTLLSVMTPLFIGTLVLASATAAIAWLAVRGLWGHLVMRAWRRRTVASEPRASRV
jgi:uncharacterized protein